MGDHILNFSAGNEFTLGFESGEFNRSSFRGSGDRSGFGMGNPPEGGMGGRGGGGGIAWWRRNASRWDRLRRDKDQVLKKLILKFGWSLGANDNKCTSLSVSVILSQFFSKS